MAKARNNRADVAETARQGEVGRLLRETRESMGVDLRGASDSLCIRFAHLSAIEEGRYGDLPGPAYAVGFVRTYAEFLRLDGEEIVRRFKEESAIEPQNELAFPTPVNEGGLPSGALIAAAVLLAAGVYGAWHFTADGDRSVVEMIQDVPERLTALMPSREEAPPVVLPAADPPGADSGTASTAVTPAASPTVTSITDEPRRFLDQETVAARLAEAQSQAASAEAPAPAPGADVAPVTAAAPPDPAASQLPPSAAGPDATRPGEQAVVVVDEPPPPEDDVAVVPPEAAADTADAEEPAEAVPPAAAPAATAEAPAAAPAPTAASAPAPAPAPAPAVAASEPNTAPVKPPASKAVVEQSAQAAGDPVPAPMPTVADDRAAPPAPALQEAAAPADGRVFWPENGDARVVLKVKADSWVQIRDHDALLLTRLLKRGDTLMVPNRDGLTLMTGNAGGMVIEVDGAPVAPLGHTGEVRRGVSLDAESLKGAAARTN